MSSEKSRTQSAGQQELNLIRLKIEIEEQQKRAARAREFKAAEDVKWGRIKKERARKRLLRESKGQSARPIGRYPAIGIKPENKDKKKQGNG